MSYTVIQQHTHYRLIMVFKSILLFFSFFQTHYQPNCTKTNRLMSFLYFFFFSIRKIIRFAIWLQMICFLLIPLLHSVFLHISLASFSFKLDMVRKTNILITDSYTIEQIYLNQLGVIWSYFNSEFRAGVGSFQSE